CCSLSCRASLAVNSTLYRPGLNGADEARWRGASGENGGAWSARTDGAARPSSGAHVGWTASTRGAALGACEAHGDWTASVLGADETHRDWTDASATEACARAARVGPGSGNLRMRVGTLGGRAVVAARRAISRLFLPLARSSNCT